MAQWAAESFNRSDVGPQAHLLSCRFYTFSVFPSSHSCIPSKPNSMFHPRTPLKEQCAAGGSRKASKDEKLLHFSNITASICHVWIESSTCDVVKMQRLRNDTRAFTDSLSGTHAETEDLRKCFTWERDKIFQIASREKIKLIFYCMR